MHTKYNTTGNQLPETPHYQDCHASHNWEVNIHYVRSRKFNRKVGACIGACIIVHAPTFQLIKIEWPMLHGPIAQVGLMQALSFFLFFGDIFCFSEYLSSKRWWSLRLPETGTETIYQTYRSVRSFISCWWWHEKKKLTLWHKVTKRWWSLRLPETIYQTYQSNQTMVKYETACR